MKDNKTAFFTAASIVFNEKDFGDIFSEKGTLNYINETSASCDNGETLLATLNLGKYCYEHTKSLEEILNCFVAYDYLLKLEEQFQYRLPNQKKEKRKKDEEKKIESLEIDMEQAEKELKSYFCQYIKLNMLPKMSYHQKLETVTIDDETYIKAKNPEVKKTFLKHFIEWLKICGIDEDKIHRTKTNCVIPMDYVISIISYCIHIYKFYNEIKENDSIPEGIEMELTYITNGSDYNLDTNPGQISFDIAFKKLEHLIYFDMFTYERRSGKRLNLCPYCAILFLGRKDKKCCSNSCKEYFNQKYEKRKVREAKKLNDTTVKQE